MSKLRGYGLCSHDAIRGIALRGLHYMLISILTLGWQGIDALKRLRTAIVNLSTPFIILRRTPSLREIWLSQNMLPYQD